MILTSAFLIYGVSSFMILITDLIYPSATVIWLDLHYSATIWCMLIFQVIILAIMVMSSIQLAKYSWKELKKMDNNN